MSSGRRDFAEKVSTPAKCGAHPLSRLRFFGLLTDLSTENVHGFSCQPASLSHCGAGCPGYGRPDPAKYISGCCFPLGRGLKII